MAATLAGCSLFATPTPAPVTDPGSLAPAGPVGYVVCSDAVTPVELDTHTAEAADPPAHPGDTGPRQFRHRHLDRRPVGLRGDQRRGGAEPIGRLHLGSAGHPQRQRHQPTTGTTTPSGVAVQNVVIPINLVTQKAEAPIKIPGQGGTHAVVVLPGGRIVLAASGSTIVPVDVATGQGRNTARPRTGPHHLRHGPRPHQHHPLRLGGRRRVPGRHGQRHRRGGDPHRAVRLVGLLAARHRRHRGRQDGLCGGAGGHRLRGRVLPIVAASGTTAAPTGFDRSASPIRPRWPSPPTDSLLLVADAANNWVNPVPLATFSDPPAPVRLPQKSAGASSGTGHPTDIVIGPGDTGAFVVDGFDAVVPFQPASETFGPPIPVCSGASSMAVAPAP